MLRVSVIIPTHNRAALLTQAVASARQAGSDLEVIVVDDASTDNTPQVCADLQGIRYIRLERNQGLSNARNTGILQSSAEFIAFLDDDDLRLPGSLDAQVRALEGSPEAGFVYGRAFIGDSQRCLPTGEVVPDRCPTGDIFWALLESNFVPMPSVLARRRCLLERGMFDVGLPEVEDWDMWLRLAEQFPVEAVEDPVAVYRKASAASGQMSSQPLRIYRRALRVQERALRSPRALAASPARRKRARRHLSDLYYVDLMWHVTSALAEGDKRAARANLREAFRIRPLRTIAGGWPLRLLLAGGGDKPPEPASTAE